MVKASSGRYLLRTEGRPVRKFPLPEKGVVEVGSDRACAIRLEGEDVRPAHCSLHCVGEKVVLTVPPGAAPVPINGEGTTRHLLNPGDVLAIGSVRLVFAERPGERLVGTRLGGYLVKEKLGVGATGTVYKAVQLSLNRTVALKILSPELTRDREFVVKFLREAQAIARLNHPNVVPIYDATQAESYFLFSIEYMPGGTLGDRIKREKRLSVEAALSAGIDAARALAWAEEQGLIHRDIKPDNLLISEDGTIKVADLGLAVDRIMDARKKSKKWAGSPRYMAPEQALGKPIDHRADIYALGATLFVALTGRPLFRGKTPLEVIKKKLKLEPPRVESIRPDIPRSAALAINTMVARDPADRHASCHEVLAALEDALSELRDPTPVRSASPPVSAAARGPGPAARSQRARGGSLPGQPERTAAFPLRTALVAGSVVVSLLLLVLILSTLEDLRSGRPNNPGAPATPEVTTAGGGSGAGNPRPGPGSTESPRPPGDTGARTGEPAAGGAEPGPVPPVTPRDRPGGRGPGQRFPEVQRLVDDYNSRLLSPEVTLSRLKQLRGGSREAAFLETVNAVIASVERDLARKTEEVVRERINEDVTPLLEKRKFRRAEIELASLLEDYPQNREMIVEVGKLATDQATEALRSLETEVDELLPQGEFEKAAAKLIAAKPDFPRSMDGAIQEKVDSVMALKSEFEAGRETLARLAKESEAALRTLDFKKALDLISLPAETSAHDAVKALLAAERQTMAQRVEKAASAWDKVARGLARAASEGRSVEIVDYLRPDPEQSRYRLAGIEGPAIRLVGASGRDGGGLDFLSVSDNELIALLASEGGKPSPADLEGLGLVVKAYGNPFRARSFLLHEALPEEVRRQHAASLSEAESGYMSRALGRLSGAMARLGGQSTPAPGADGGTIDSWEALAGAVRHEVLVARSSEHYATWRPALRNIFVKARTETLRSDVPDILFRGDVRTYSKTRREIKLLYEFDDPEEFADFRPKLDEGCRIDPVNGTARIRGEYRFLEGDPFINTLTITGLVPGGGYNGAAPNINLALWTRDDDTVSPPQIRTITSSTGSSSTGTTSRRPLVPSSAMPKDYFVFGIGYKSTYYNYLYYEYGLLDVHGLNTTVQMPATVLISGTRTKSIHTLPTVECMWGVGVISQVKGNQPFKIHMDSRSVVWIVKGKAIPLNKSKDVERFQRTEPYLGSFTIFTNNERVHYANLVVEGELNPAWIDEQLTRLADDRFAAIEADRS